MITPYPGFIITGSDTDVGKTLVSAVLMKSLKGTYWKPIQSGASTDNDRDMVKRLTGLGDEHFMEEVYRLQQPLSPHQAAKIDGIAIDPSNIKLPPATDIRNRPLIVEGAGGILVPITDDYLMTDLFRDLGLPVLVVCRNRLGVINHMLMTLEVLKARSISVMGFISSGGAGVADNLDTISRLSGVPLLGTLPEMKHDDFGKLDELCSRVDTHGMMRSIGI
jgi:dethiobiotin synthetase